MWVTGNAEIQFDRYTAIAIQRHAERARQRRAGHSGCPQHGARSDTLIADAHPCLIHMRDGAARDHRDTQLFKLPLRAGGQFRRERRQDPRSGFDKYYARAARVDAAKFILEGVARDFCQGSRKLDTGRSGSNDHEGEKGPDLIRVAACLRALECIEDAGADAQCVSQCL
jgi:hypothetical protein